jgi:hypothetical protein
MESTNYFYGKMVGQMGGYNGDEKLYFVNCDGTNATLVPLYDQGTKDAETARLSFCEEHRADFCQTALTAATDNLLGGERYCRGEIYFEGQRFVSDWDGKRAATMITESVDGITRYLVYSPYDLAKAQAQKYIDDYLGSYPKVSAFLEQVVENGTEKGYVCTMHGRRRYVHELKAKNKMVQAAGKRIAMNTPVQGTAADIIKLAMVHVHDRLEREVPSARLLLQVHDELIVEVPLADADAAAKVLHEEMQQVCELAVPLIAEVNRGETWYDAKG